MNIYENLYSWQKKIVNKFKDKDAFGIFLDMGLGKTPISLSFAEQNKCSKVLIITLNNKALEDETVKGSWLWWANKSELSYTFKTKKSKDFSTNPELMIINYEAIFERGKSRNQRVTIKKCIADFIESSKFHNCAIIIDESHKVKNLQSQQTAAIIKIQKEFQRVSKRTFTYLLTGTPFTTGYIDLYAQLKILGCEMTKGSFVDEFCVRGNIPGLLGWQQPIVGYRNVKSLFNLLHQYAITIKSDDVEQLPEKIFVNHVSPQSKDFEMFIQEKANIDDIRETFVRHGDKLMSPSVEGLKTKMVNPFYRNIAYPDLNWMAETSGTYWLRARQLSIGFQGNAEESKWYDKTRLQQLETFLRDNEDNYLLFYNFTPELIEIYDICERLGYNIDVYCGEIKSLDNYYRYANSTEAEKLVNKKNILISNFASGSTGGNWQEYYHCILFSCPLYKDYEQGIKRIHRIGQTHTTIYHTFYQDNWLDRSMTKALQEHIDYSVKMFESDLERIKSIKND